MTERRATYGTPVLAHVTSRARRASRALSMNLRDRDRFPLWLMLCFSHLIAFGIGVMVGGCQVGR